jgi:hypothetical protein
MSRIGFELSPETVECSIQKNQVDVTDSAETKVPNTD